MTGYARLEGQCGGANWSWDLKSVNGKGLEARVRVPPAFDAVEVEARARIASRLKRGTVQATLSLQRPKRDQAVRIDAARLAGLLAALDGLELPAGVSPASLDGLLAVPGVVEVADVPEDRAASVELAADMLRGLDAALDALVAMRRGEGRGLGRLLGERLDAVERLVARADAAPGRAPEAVRDRLARRVAELGAAVPALDPARLHQEAVLLAVKGDVREELDRLALHRGAAAALLAEGGAVGRRLDFLAQELGREAATLCAKSNDAGLTLVGLDLRTEIEQFREQVQNLE